MQAIDLRVASLEDKPVLLEFEQEVLQAERPYNSDIRLERAFYYDLDDLITNENSNLILAEVQREVIGCGYAQIRESKQSLAHDTHAYLGFMYVTPEYRGRGVNKKIIGKLIDWSKSQGVSRCYLDVYSENEGAVRAYKKAGFIDSMTEMKLNLK